MRKLICVCLAVMLLAGVCIACAEEKIIEVENKVPIPKLAPKDRAAAAGESPFTGLPASGEAYTPIMVPLDNSPEGHPLWGIGDASVLFQIPLSDNGSTRLMALFGDTYPEQVGGVRSARMTMLPLVRAFNAVFAYGGMPPIKTGPVSVDTWMTEWGFRKPTRHYNLLGDEYRERVSFVADPHNLSAHVKDLHIHLTQRQMDYEGRAFLFTDEPLDRGEKAAVISVQYRNHKSPSKTSPNSASTFTWNPEKGYIRTSAAGETTDRNGGEAIPFANVIIMRVPLQWEKSYPYYAAQMQGSGQADIFQNGRYIQGAWTHPNDTDRLVFLDETGKELAFQRGKTFIVVGDEIIVSYSDDSQ